MTTQPVHHPPLDLERPRTVRSVRRRLTAEQRERFDQALNDAVPAKLFSLVARWAAVAQSNSVAAVARPNSAARTGTAGVHTLGEVIPALGGTPVTLRYHVVFTNEAATALRALDGVDRLVGIPPGALSPDARRALLTGTTLGQLLDELGLLAADPYRGPSLPRTGGNDDDRVLPGGALAVTYLVMPAPVAVATVTSLSTLTP